MSFEATAWAMRQMTGSPGAKLVLLALSDHLNRDTGRCFPKVETLAVECEMSVRSVKTHLQRLKGLGLIMWEHTRRPDGSQGPSAYELLMTDTRVQILHPPRANIAPTPVQNLHPPRAESAPPVEPGSEPRTTNTPPTPPRGSDADAPHDDTPLQAPPKTPRTRGTRLPPDWQPGPDLIAWARTECPTTHRADSDAFCDYWHAQPGTKGMKLDWPATWRNWMRREHQRRNHTTRPVDRPRPGDDWVANILKDHT